MKPLRRLADLPQDALQVLAELECLMDDDGLGHGTSDEPEFMRYRRIMLTCRPDEITFFTGQAVSELKSCRRRETPAIDRYDVRAVVLRECEGWTPTDVERSSHKASSRSVRKWRVDAGRFPESGKVMPGAPGTTAEKVRELALEGKTVRVIAMTVGLPKSTVHDMLVALEKAA